ncbi:MAG TPA: glycosyl hydrolase, partial [Bacillota bacterium]|nr:glycosyl hydrolase [Bacillota bacterium]
CKLAGICVDRPRTGFVGKGSLWIDDVAVLQPAKQAPTRALQVETRGRRFGNLYAVGDTVALRAHGEGERVRWSVTDFFDHELSQGEGPAAAADIAFLLKQPGWFSCKLELLAGGRAVGTQLLRCAALPGGAEPARSDFVGVCSHFGQSSYPLEAMNLMQRYGIDQFRDEISWGGYEQQKGQLAMPAFGTAFLKRAAELKMRPLLIFDYANRHYDKGAYPNSPEAIEAFGRYAVDLVRQTRGTVNMFEVWNEWVGGCGMDGRSGQHDGEAYGRLLQPTYRAVKHAFPDVTVVGIGGEYGAHCAENILGAIRTAGTNSMDAWSIHPYRYPNAPEFSDLVGEVNRIQAQVAQTGERTKAWVTEIGYPTHRGGNGSDEAAQARYLVRTLALLQSTRTVEKVFWYDLKDDGLTRDYNEHNFGLIRHERFNCAPKPGMVALSAFIRLTGGAEFKDLRRDNGLYLANYRRPDGSEVVLLWAEQGRRTVRIAGELGAVHDLMGNAVAAATAGVVEAGENPVYVSGRSLRIAAK